jgi:hypothetical protein
MQVDATRILLFGATAAIGLLAGASLDQSIKQLPARRRIGVAAFARYSQASDLRSGVAFYSSIGIGAALLNVAAAVADRKQHNGGDGATALNVGATLALGHSLVTAQAAPLNFSQRRAHSDAALSQIFDRFERLQALRCLLQLANFGVNLRALVLLSSRRV